MDHRLLDMLVCPVCKGPLEDRRHSPTSGTSATGATPAAGAHPSASASATARPLPPRELVCPADRLAFPVRDGIPVMLATEARTLDAEGEHA